MLPAYYFVEEAEPCDTHKLAFYRHMWANWPPKGQRCVHGRHSSNGKLENKEQNKCKGLQICVLKNKWEGVPAKTNQEK